MLFNTNRKESIAEYSNSAMRRAQNQNVIESCNKHMLAIISQKSP